VQTPPGIVFHDVERSAWVERYILERVGRMDRRARGITRCHVTLAREQTSHHKGNVYSVMVQVHLPPQHDLAVKKQRALHDMPAELPALINVAFGAIEREIERTAAARRGVARGAHRVRDAEE
jgi:hypothetical protein